MNNLYPIQSRIGSSQRQEMMNQKPLLIWFTGLSGSGKSTLAVQLEMRLFERGFKTYLLDGDNIRTGLNKDLTFTEEGRIENIRRIGEVSKLMLDAGLVVLSAFISPFNADREQVRSIVGKDNYFEVFVDTPLEVCEQRDVKGLYQKARRGEIRNFTGIDSPYERPTNSDLVIETDRVSVDDAIADLVEAVFPKISVPSGKMRN